MSKLSLEECRARMDEMTTWMDEMTKVFWKCPSCGYTNAVVMDLNRERRLVISCDDCRKTAAVAMPEQIWAQAYVITGIDGGIDIPRDM